MRRHEPATMGGGPRRRRAEPAARPHDMCTEKHCDNGSAVCNPWLVGDLLLPARVRLPPAPRAALINNTRALVLTSRTLGSCVSGCRPLAGQVRLRKG